MELPKYRYINNLSAITCPIVKFFVTRNVTRIFLFLSVSACEIKQKKCIISTIKDADRCTMLLGLGIQGVYRNRLETLIYQPFQRG